MIKHIAGTSLVFEEKGILLLGPSGSGKSTYCRDYLIMYKEFYPSNEIYIVSKDGEDPAFKGLGAKRIELDLFSEPVSIDDVDPNCIVVFDDVDSMKKAYDKITW